MVCSNILVFKDPKDPDSNLPYSFTWTSWTAKESTTLVDNVSNREIIVAVTEDYDVSEDINPIVVGSIITDVPNSIIYVWLSGGTDGLKYNITCRVTTADGKTEDQTAVLTCAEK